MAGTLDLVQRAYLGTEIRDDVVYLRPAAINQLDGLEVPLQIRRTPVVVSVHGRQLTVRTAHGFTEPEPIKVNVCGVERELGVDESTTFMLPDRAVPSPSSV
jgi:trehalose/maltose hydrolase-like predicted phosphorylase